jgi:hypothetical protein
MGTREVETRESLIHSADRTIDGLTESVVIVFTDGGTKSESFDGEKNKMSSWAN